MDSNTKNIDKLKRLLSLMDEDALTREEFIKNFKNVLDLVNKIKDSNASQFNAFTNDFSNFKDNLEKNNTSKLEEFRNNIDEIDSKFVVLGEEIASKIANIIEKLENNENNKPIDEERVIKETLTRIEFPEYKETILDTPEQIRDKLEKLEGENRLDYTAIKGLEDYIKQLSSKLKGKNEPRVGGLRPADTGVETPSGTINGVNKAFTVTFVPKWLTINGQALYSDNGYALTSSSGVLTVTLDNAPLTNDILRSHY
jgi:hypothetical protein